MTDASPCTLPQPLQKGKKKRELMEDQWIALYLTILEMIKDGAFSGGALSSAVVDWHVTRQTISRLWKRYSHSAVSPLSKLSLARSDRHKRTGRPKVYVPDMLVADMILLPLSDRKTNVL